MVGDLTLRNSLSKISFCDKECYNVNNNKVKEQILNYISEAHNIQVIEREYVLLNPHMLKNITYNQHILATYTNGNPYILLFKIIDDVPCCIFIDRKLKNGYSYPKIHCVQYNMKTDLFKDDNGIETDTILTGELVRDINRDWQFLISDILLYKNEVMKQKNVLSRFETIHTMLEENYVSDNNIEICPLYVKRLFQYKDIKYIFNEYMPSLTYVCKGLVFYTMNTKFSNYALQLPREQHIQVKSNKEVEDEFFNTYPNYQKYRNLLDNNMSLLTNTNTNTIDMNFNINSVFSNNSNNTNNSNNNKKDVLDNQQNNILENNLGNNNQQNKKNKLDLISSSNIHQNLQSSKNIDTNHSNEFLIYKTGVPDIYNLYKFKKSGSSFEKGESVGNAYILNIELSIKLFKYLDKIEKMENSVELIDHVVVNCYYHKYFKKYIPFEIYIS